MALRRPGRRMDDRSGIPRGPPAGTDRQADAATPSTTWSIESGGEHLGCSDTNHGRRSIAGHGRAADPSLGGFLAEWGVHPIPLIPSRLGRSLLAYLVINRNRPQMRDYLGGMFWPDLSEGRARRRLSHAPSGRCKTPCLRSAIHSGSWQSHPMSSHLHPPPLTGSMPRFERTLEDVGRPDPARAPAADLGVAPLCRALPRRPPPRGLRGGWLSSRSATSSSSAPSSNWSRWRRPTATRRHSPTPAGSPTTTRCERHRTRK